MKRRLVSSKDGNTSYILLKEGYYWVNWKSSEFCFFHSKLNLEEQFYSSKWFQLRERTKFTPISGGTAQKATCAAISTPDYIFLLEYVEGDVALHSHREGIEEIYLSAEEPYNLRGEFCKSGEEHKTFCKKTLALKRVPRNA